MNVRGVLFLDYVRMLKSRKDVAWVDHLEPGDMRFLKAKIDPDIWYPMATFERMGNAILGVIASGDLRPVEMWGRFSVAQLHAAHPKLLAPGDPVETLNRFRVLRQTFFDFPALDVLMLHDDEAQIAITYHMGMPAEEAASMQTLGFFASLLELAGARDVKARLRAKSWAGDPKTILELTWSAPNARGR
ncbi:MAG TPA: hypothetical protein VGF94_14970 [Kofleriaceae bacterium]